MRRTTRTLLAEGDGSVVRRTVLPCGLRIVTEHVPSVRSVSLGIWVGVGSRDETPGQAGAAHYLEHLLFKGTRTRTALDISAAIDSVGGELNAFTDKEFTCFYARVLDTDLPLAIDVVTDVVTQATLEAHDVESERGVILEEIAMRDDDPADLVHEDFARALFGDTDLGRSILGSVQTIESITPRAIRSFYVRHYRPEHMVVAVAGSLEHGEVVRLVERAFARSGLLDGHAEPDPPRIGPVRRRRPRASIITSRSTEQANLVLGVPSYRRSDERRFAVGVLNAALGGGMSSRLFQRVREERGLAYSVYSFSGAYAEAGYLGIYAGCHPSKARDVLAICRDELNLLSAHGITAQELQRGKGQLRGSMVLGQEDTGARMSRIAKGELVYDELLSVREVLGRVEAVTAEEVQAVASDLLSAEPSLAVIGPFDATTIE